MATALTNCQHGLDVHGVSVQPYPAWRPIVFLEFLRRIVVNDHCPQIVALPLSQPIVVRRVHLNDLYRVATLEATCLLHRIVVWQIVGVKADCHDHCLITCLGVTHALVVGQPLYCFLTCRKQDQLFPSILCTDATRELLNCPICHSQESCIPALSLPWTSSSCHCPGHRSKPFPSCPQAKGLSLGCAGHCRSHLDAPIVRLYFQSEATSDWHSPEQRSSLCFWPCRTRLSADCEETRLRWRKHCFLLVDKMSTSMQFYSKQKFKHIALDCLTPTLSDSTFMQQEIKRWCL